MPERPGSETQGLSDRIGVKRIVEEATDFLSDAESLGDVEQFLREIGGDRSLLTEADLKELEQLAALATASGEDDQVAVQLLRAHGKVRLSVSDEGMRVIARIDPPRAGGKAITAEQVIELMQTQHMAHGIDVDAIREAVDAAAHGELVDGVTVAVGQAPVPGTPSRFELRVRLAMDADPSGMELDEPDCRVDHTMLCAEGDVILKQTPAKRGQAGFDVFGAPINPPPVNQPPVSVGRNVRQDGRVFIAETAGQVSLQAGRLEVRRVLTLKQDVLRSQGLVEFDGDIHVLAAVRSGAVMRASGDITVDGAVEDAEIESTHGSVTLVHGVAGRHRGKIVAAGDVQTRFAENVSIVAYNDLTVQNGALHCRLVAGRQLSIVAGRGQLIGGVALVGEKLVTRQLGAASGVKTEVRVGLDRQAMASLAELENKMAQLTRRLERAREVIERFERTVGDPKRLDAAGREAFGQLRKAALVCSIKRRKVVEQRDEMLAGTASSTTGLVDIHGQLMPGVVVWMGAASFTADQQLRHIRLAFDQTRRKIKAKPLNA